MTVLEKLGILGIRSFSPDNLEVLAFERPLTLIVGHNGAGKTTVVECLKMATTGELPPNCGKGQYFVHNPRNFEYTDVKGQIRLVFKTSQQKKILANRSYQLLSTKDRKGKVKTSYKALESVLQVKDLDGNTKSLSKKCAEMDQQLAQLMGISKAILENVIFCHQEENNWPLGEMVKLKKKFDDLFGATRYSKALEIINTLRKDHQKIGKDKLHQVELLKSVLDQASSLREKIEKSLQTNIKYQEEMQALSAKLKEHKTQVSALNAKLAEIQSLERDIEVNKRIIANLEEEIKVIQKKNVQEYSEELDELVVLRSNVQASSLKQKEDIKSFESECYRLELEQRKLSSYLEKAQLSFLESARAEERLKATEKRKEVLLISLKSNFKNEEWSEASSNTNIMKKIK